MSFCIRNSKHGDISIGTIIYWNKRYSDKEVGEFCELTGGPAHPVPEHLPYLMVIAPLTKLGGDLNYLSGGMSWTAVRPVRRDETLTAEMEVTHLEPGEGMAKIAFGARIRCGDEIVVSGHSKGFIVIGQTSDSP